MKYHLSTLKNGATLLRVPLPSSKSVTVLALVNAGRRYETAPLAGISHFLEHMVFKGTASYPNAQVLSSVIDEVGGEFNAFTSKEYTGYYVKLASRYMQTALDVVTDMLCVPELRQEDIDREVNVIVEEINMYEDMPMRNIQDIFDELMFSQSNLSGRILGSKETVRALSSEDFKQYMNEWYGFKNVVVVVAGDDSVVDDESLVATVEQMLSKGGDERRAGEHASFLTKQYGDERKRIVFKETEQAHFVMGLPTFSREDSRRYALSVLSTLLGKTMSSRLFTEIREKRGLCYYVRSEMDFYRDVGVFGAAAGVDPKRINEAVAATKHEFLAALSEKPITEKEVVAAKQNLVGSLALELEDSQSVAGWYGMKQLLEGKVETEEEATARIEAVTLTDVVSVLEDVVKEEALRFALIGPFTPEKITEI